VPVKRILSLVTFALLVAVVLTGVGALRQDSAPVRAQDEPAVLDLSFTAPQVWAPSDAVERRLFDCHEQFGCVEQVMRQAGAPEAAIAFFRLTSQFLTDVIDTGEIKVGTEFSPWRANSNSQSVLLGGVPAVITPALNGAERQAEADPTFLELKKQYPNLVVWPVDQVFESVAVSDDGGMSFVFRFGLHDLCHACGTPWDARYSFNFDPDLTFKGVHYLDIERH
jgi:hypothetical protein